MKKTAKLNAGRQEYDRMFKKDMKDPVFKAEYEREASLLKLAFLISVERKNRHLSQKQLAEKAKMKQQEIARLENAKHSPTFDTLLKVAHGLGKELHVEFR